jgi:hypothetical protein
MLINGLNQVAVNRALGNTSDIIYGGFGFKNTAQRLLCMDENAPSGNFWVNGFRVSSTGCIFIVVGTDPSDVWHSGLRRTTQGQLVIEEGVGVSFVNGNPLTANGVLATIAI